MPVSDTRLQHPWLPTPPPRLAPDTERQIEKERPWTGERQRTQPTHGFRSRDGAHGGEDSQKFRPRASIFPSLSYHSLCKRGFRV